MRNAPFRKILVAALVGVLWATSAGVALCADTGLIPNITISVAIKPTEVTVGESAHVEVSIAWQGSQDAYAIEQVGAPERGGVALTAISDASSTTQESGKPHFHRAITYVVDADQPGTISLSPARFTLKPPAGAAHEYKSESLGVIVRPARAPISPELLLGLVAIGLVGIAVRAARSSKPAMPPERNRADRAAERIAGLRAVGHRDHRQFFDACFDAMREGLADEAPAVARDRDRAKIVAALKSAGISEPRTAAADELVALCDSARFNPEAPDSAARERALNLLQTALS